MGRVWKVGSRWGNQGPSVLDLFLEYGCVFFGDSHADRKLGHWQEVKKGDLFIVSDGETPVAVGEALGAFSDYDASGFSFREPDYSKFIEGCDVQLCRSRLVLLLPKERDECWGIDARKRFCEAFGAKDKVEKYWSSRMNSREGGAFDIKTRVVSLADGRDGERIFQKNYRYHIPIYQRPYSWSEAELRKLMEDLAQGMKNSDPIFMGTMQLSQPVIIDRQGHERSYDVIDGQQRLTTFMILLLLLDKILGEHRWLTIFESNIRTSVNKRAAQHDLDRLYSFMKTRPIGSPLTDIEQLNPYLRNCQLLYALVRELAASDIEDEVINTTDDSVRNFSRRMYSFIECSLKIVVIETHAGLSKTLKIFNTINTSGLDLGAEDLFKVRFYEYVKCKDGAGDDVFDEISSVYESVAEYNKHPYADTYLSMAGILSTYQRALIGLNNLNVETFSMSQESFFDQLFDTELKVHEWPVFKNFSGKLTLPDLKKVFDCYVCYLKSCQENPRLKMFRHFLWETRYGYVANFPVLALFFGVIDEKHLEEFTGGLVKVLVPASIYFQKTVSRGRTQLVDLLKAMGNGSFGSNSVQKWGVEKWFDGTMVSMMEHGLGYEIAGVTKWKNLLCKLVEYVETPEGERNEDLFARLFGREFDIEHIQPYTDEKDSDAVWNEWRSEINKIGNLAMFERDKNRGVQNHSEKKAMAYANSQYRSLSCLKDRVANWSKDDAMNRGKMICEELKKFLFTEAI